MMGKTTGMASGRKLVYKIPGERRDFRRGKGVGGELDHGGGLDHRSRALDGEQAGAAGGAKAVLHGAVRAAGHGKADAAGAGESAHARERISKPDGKAALGEGLKKRAKCAMIKARPHSDAKELMDRSTRMHVRVDQSFCINKYCKNVT